MSRYIDVDALIESICHTADLGGWIGDTLRNIKRLAVRYINETPSIDIVRCQVCIYCYYNDEHKMYRCTKADIEHWMWNADKHFCSYGEREGE